MAFLSYLRNVGTAGDLNCVFKRLVSSFLPCGATSENLMSKTNTVTLVICLISCSQRYYSEHFMYDDR